MRGNESKHLFGSKTRLFINLELGCASACSYCYLPSEGLQIDAIPEPSLRITASRALSQLEGDVRVTRGREGTLFSIGCFSECWDHRMRSETIRLIHGLLPFGNPIQLATKRKLSKGDLKTIVHSPHWNGQLSAYISSSTISAWERHERGTTRPVSRFESFSACREFGVHAFLYIKPVLPGITIADVSIYGALLIRHQIGAVVGDLFEVGATGNQSPISPTLTIANHPDVDRLRSGLAVYGPVYCNSIDSLESKEWS